MKYSMLKSLSALICISFLIQPVKAAASEDLVIGSLLGLAVGLAVDQHHTSVVREIHVNPGHHHRRHHRPLRRHYSTYNRHYDHPRHYSRHDIRRDLKAARRAERRAERRLERAERRADRAERRARRNRHHHFYEEPRHVERYRYAPRREITTIRTFDGQKFTQEPRSVVRAQRGI